MKVNLIRRLAEKKDSLVEWVDNLSPLGFMMFIIIVAFVVIFVLDSIHEATASDSTTRIQQAVVKQLKKIHYEGHTYLILKDTHSTDGILGMCHDECCQCKETKDRSDR